MKLYDSGVYLVKGKEIVADSPDAPAAIMQKTGSAVSKEEAAKNTIAYGILKEHRKTKDSVRQADVT